jgi:F0F1-type ATP synthase membrane subunit c/vacuolar-type H+-ATPase subunit K
MDRNLLAGLTIVLGAMVPAAMIGRFSTEAMKSLGRNPQSGPMISANLMLCLVLTEAIAIYSLVVAFAIKFVE